MDCPPVGSADVSPQCSAAQWLQPTSFNSTVFQPQGLEDFVPEVFRARIPETCYPRRPHAE